MAITAAQVKELREMTGAGMMDCKKALTATDGDMDKAVEFLREKGLATAQKKASRVAAEGLCKTLVAENEKNDHWALDNGYVAITPTTVDATAYGLIDELKAWF